MKPQADEEFFDENDQVREVAKRSCYQMMN